MQRITQKRVIPVIVIDKVADAVPMAEALIKGGLDLLEVTFRTAAAEGAIREILKRFPDVLIGAGTLLTVEQVKRARDAGAKFGVAPGINEKIVLQAKAEGMPFVPGVMTPSDVEKGLELGCRLLKFFPAESAGGVKMLQALAGPYGHTGVKFIPLGGISAANVAAYFALPIVGAVGGTWIAEKQLIANHQWDEITRRAADVLKAAATPAPGK